MSLPTREPRASTPLSACFGVVSCGGYRFSWWKTALLLQTHARNENLASRQLRRVIACRGIPTLSERGADVCQYMPACILPTGSTFIGSGSNRKPLVVRCPSILSLETPMFTFSRCRLRIQR
jgi:hypothetical protein